jgi:hypothetical protein
MYVNLTITAPSFMGVPRLNRYEVSMVRAGIGAEYATNNILLPSTKFLDAPSPPTGVFRVPGTQIQISFTSADLVDGETVHDADTFVFAVRAWNAVGAGAWTATPEIQYNSVSNTLTQVAGNNMVAAEFVAVEDVYAKFDRITCDLRGSSDPTVTTIGPATILECADHCSNELDECTGFDVEVDQTTDLDTLTDWSVVDNCYFTNTMTSWDDYAIAMISSDSTRCYIRSDAIPQEIGGTRGLGAKSLVLDGFVRYELESSLNNTDFGVGFWMKIDATLPIDTPLFETEGGGFRIYATEHGRIEVKVRVRSADNSITEKTREFTPPLNTWFHLQATWRWAYGQWLRVSSNGVMLGQEATTNGAQTQKIDGVQDSGTTKMLLGASFTDTTNMLTAKIANFTLWRDIGANGMGSVDIKDLTDGPWDNAVTRAACAAWYRFADNKIFDDARTSIMHYTGIPAYSSDVPS